MSSRIVGILCLLGSFAVTLIAVDASPAQGPIRRRIAERRRERCECRCEQVLNCAICECTRLYGHDPVALKNCIYGKQWEYYDCLVCCERRHGCGTHSACEHCNAGGHRDGGRFMDCNDAYNNAIIECSSATGGDPQHPSDKCIQYAQCKKSKCNHLNNCTQNPCMHPGPECDYTE